MKSTDSAKESLLGCIFHIFFKINKLTTAQNTHAKPLIIHFTRSRLVLKSLL